MRKIKVVVCINDFLVGGAQRMLADMLRHIDRDVFDVSLVTLFYWEGKDYFYDMLPPDIPVHRLRFSGFTDVRNWRELSKLLKTIDADIVLSNLFFSNAVVRLLKPFFRYKVVAVEHNTYVNKTKMHQLVDRLLAHGTARIVAVSQSVADFTSAQESIPKEKFRIIHNGIDIAALQAERDRYDAVRTKKELGIPATGSVILNIARLTTQKNPMLLLKGFAIFAQKHPKYVLVMVGGGQKWNVALTKEAETLGITNRVFLVGMRKDVARFYAIADFFVSTSTIEGFGIAHAEALACGVPVLSTRTAGPDVMIHEGENGFFIENSTPEAVAQGMERIASADLARMREFARESARPYAIQKTARAYEELFREVAAI